MKKSSTILFSAAVLGLTAFALQQQPTAAATTTTDTTTSTTQQAVATETKATADNPAASVINVQSIVKIGANGAAIYAHPSDAQPTSRVLKAGTTWKSPAQAYDGFLWFNLGGDQWVHGTDLATETQEAAAQTTPTTKPVKTSNAAGKVQVAFQKGKSVNLWNNYKGGKHIPGKMVKSGTTWKFYKKVNNGGAVWYNLGGNQWIYGKYVKVVK